MGPLGTTFAGRTIFVGWFAVFPLDTPDLTPRQQGVCVRTLLLGLGWVFRVAKPQLSLKGMFGHVQDVFKTILTC